MSTKPATQSTVVGAARSAEEFGEACDKAMIVEGLDHFLNLELTFARKADDRPRTEAVSALLRLRGREDLAEVVGYGGALGSPQVVDWRLPLSCPSTVPRPGP